MELTLQVTLSCHACGEASSPVNAAVDQVECIGCGATLHIPDSVWAGALEGVRHRAAGLAESARGHETLRTRGGELRVGYARIPTSCPHCNAHWGTLPDGDCPECAQPVHRRAPPVHVEGVESLVAEDRALVLGAEAAGLGGTLGCSSCGAPLDLQSERKVKCGACDAQTVIPDEIWRRSNAPQLTAQWVVVLDAEGAGHPLEGVGIEHMAVGSDGTVFMIGSEHPIDMVTALTPDLKRRLWTHELSGSSLYPVPLPDGRVALVPDGMPGAGERTVLVADAEGVSALFELPEGDEIVDGAAQGDTLVLARGHYRKLERYDLQGTARPIWPPAGFFARLFGGGNGPLQAAMDPGSRPLGTMTGRMGTGHDGSLLFAWGPRVVCYDADGKIKWKLHDAQWAASLSAPAGATDGTAAFCFARSSGGDWAKTQVFRVGRKGAAAEPVVERESIKAFTVAPSGEVYVVGGDHIEDVGTFYELLVFDAEGDTVHTLPMGR